MSSAALASPAQLIILRRAVKEGQANTVGRVEALGARKLAKLGLAAVEAVTPSGRTLRVGPTPAGKAYVRARAEKAVNYDADRDGQLRPPPDVCDEHGDADCLLCRGWGRG